MYHFDWIVPDWPAPENIACLSTTRYGGASQGAFSSFNLSMHVDDDARLVEKSRELLMNELQLPSEPTWLDQQHGKQVTKLSASNRNGIQADAAYAIEPGIVCTVLTADCLPVLFCDQQGTCVAVAHAGWRGLLSGVLETTLDTLPVEANKLFCWLGPAIGPKKFEVGEEVKQRFVRKDHQHRAAFQAAAGSGKYLTDIYQLAKNILTAKGIEFIFGGEHCTYTEEQRFFSYRRDGTTGRMATMIWLKF